MKMSQKVLLPALLFTVSATIMLASASESRYPLMNMIIGGFQFVPVFCFLMAHFSYRKKELANISSKEESKI